MSKITIIDGNNEIELSTAPKENIKAYMVKGEPGTNGVSPSAVVTKTGDTSTLTVTDANGTTETNITDGFNPTVVSSRSGKTTTITITDINGTATTTINDGIDLTGGVPTDGIIGFDGLVGDIPDGYEVVSDSIATQTDLNAKQDTLVSGTNIKTINSTSLLGSGDIPINVPTINDSYSTSTTEAYSCNYVNSIIESGSNANGNWIKYSDGTMICRCSQDLGGLAYDTAFGSIYWTNQVHEWTYPQEFYSAPEYVMPSIFCNTIAGATLQLLPTTTKATCFAYCFTSSTSRQTTLKWVAIGKWK